MDCGEHNVVLERIKTLSERMNNTEKETQNNTKELQALKENKATNDERFDRVFYLLGELKNSIDEIGKSLKEKNDRLPNMVFAVVGTVMGSVTTGVILWLITR